MQCVPPKKKTAKTWTSTNQRKTSNPLKSCWNERWKCFTNSIWLVCTLEAGLWKQVLQLNMQDSVGNPYIKKTSGSRASRGGGGFKTETPIAYRTEWRLCLQVTAKPSVLRSSNISICYMSHLKWSHCISSHLLSLHLTRCMQLTLISSCFFASHLTSSACELCLLMQFVILSCHSFSCFAQYFSVHLTSGHLSSSQLALPEPPSKTEKVEDVKRRLWRETSLKNWESWRCEKEDLVRDFPPKLTVEDVKTKLWCETFLNLWKLKLWKCCLNCQFHCGANPTMIPNIAETVRAPSRGRPSPSIFRGTFCRTKHSISWIRPFRKNALRARLSQVWWGTSLKSWKLKMWKGGFGARLPSETESWR